MTADCGVFPDRQLGAGPWRGPRNRAILDRMNVPVVVASDGLARRAFSVRDVERMVEIGVIGPDERLEIVDGEILVMNAKGNRHEVLKMYLNLHFAQHRSKDVLFIPEPGWELDDLTYLEPDYMFFPARIPLGEARAADALLVVEISDTSLGYDLGIKASLYADRGVREYWVVDAARRETHVHRSPGHGGWGQIRVYDAGTAVEALFAGVSVRLADLPET
jgi:Uma2 family endonuclease